MSPAGVPVTPPTVRWVTEGAVWVVNAARQSAARAPPSAIAVPAGRWMTYRSSTAQRGDGTRATEVESPAHSRLNFVAGDRPIVVATAAWSMGPGKWRITASVPATPIPTLAGRIEPVRGVVWRPAWITGAAGMATATATARAVTAMVRWVIARWRRNGST